MQIESSFRHTVELMQAAFSIRPKTFDAIDVIVADGKNIRRMIDPKMFAVADINQSVVAALAVRVNHRIQEYLAANNVLQRLSRWVRHDFSKDRTVAFVNSEDNGLAAGAATAFAANSFCPKIRFINFDLATGKRRRSLRFFGNAISDFQINSINRFARQVSQQSRFLSGQIKGKILDNLSGFALANFRKPIITV